MHIDDITVYCIDCSQPFVFSFGEQMFYASKNIINPPNRCPTCRTMHKSQKAMTKQLLCQDCNQSFEFTHGEQQYYAGKNLSEPTRCKDCRAKKRAEPRSNTQVYTPGQQRQMYAAYCADCGQATQVPFQPKIGRPVYCRNCYPAHKMS